MGAFAGPAIVRYAGFSEMRALAPKMRVSIARDADIILARQQARALAAELGFPLCDLTLIATAVSEVARNIVVYARRGEITVEIVERFGRRGVRVVASDRGPGIPDLERALSDGFSTGGSLGLGLPGARRVMDDFEVVSQVGVGTTVTMQKWARAAAGGRR
jgi:serine/threonine-protein kinase RsbT